MGINIGGINFDPVKEVTDTTRNFIKDPLGSGLPNPISGLPSGVADPVMDVIGPKIPIKVPGVPGSGGGETQQQPTYAINLPPPMTPEERARRFKEIRKERGADIATGEKRGRKLFRNQLGRVGEKRTALLDRDCRND